MSISDITQRERDYYDDFFNIIKPCILETSFNLSRMFPKIIPENNKGKNILICSCGIGLYVVAALRTGANVYAFDISKTAIEKAIEYIKINGFDECEISVMDFHNLEYKNDYFDIVFGTQILHHVDVKICGSEVHRILKKGGIAVFEENSNRNIIIRVIRNLLFSKNQYGGRNAKGKLGFQRKGTDDENPLDEYEINTLKKIFNDNLERVYNDFIFFELIGRHNKYLSKGDKLFKKLDKLVYTYLTFLRPYGFQQILVMRK